jgi:hypothetical protein
MKLLPVFTALVLMSTVAYGGVMPEELIEPTLDVANELAVVEQHAVETFTDKLQGFLHFAFMSLIILI